MKKLVLFGLAILLFTACNKKEKRYSQQSPEIDTYKKVIDAYEKQDWNALASHYAANGKLYVIPAHITARFIDGKIVREDGYWDASKLMMDIQQMEFTKNISEEIKQN